MRFLTMLTAVLALGVMVPAARADEKAVDPNSIIGKWSLDTKAMLENDEDYKKASDDDKKKMEEAVKAAKITLTVTADTLTLTVTDPEGKESSESAKYTITGVEGKTITVETKDKDNKVETSKIEMTDATHIVLLGDGNEKLFLVKAEK